MDWGAFWGACVSGGFVCWRMLPIIMLLLLCRCLRIFPGAAVVADLRVDCMALAGPKPHMAFNRLLSSIISLFALELPSLPLTPIWCGRGKPLLVILLLLLWLVVFGVLVAMILELQGNNRLLSLDAGSAPQIPFEVGWAGGGVAEDDDDSKGEAINGAAPKLNTVVAW